MKVSDVIKIAEPQHLPVLVRQKYQESLCLLGHEECEGYEFCDDYESEDDICKNDSYQLGCIDLFDGRCEEVPIKLADKKVVEISVSPRIIRKGRVGSHDGVQLIIEIASEY